jgi:hypothetical protein
MAVKATCKYWGEMFGDTSNVLSKFFLGVRKSFFLFEHCLVF